MEHAARGPGYDVWLDLLDRPFKFHSPVPGDDFVVMLIANDITITEGERAALSTDIVRQGCRYAVSIGHRCSTWDDAIDLAFLETDPNFNPPDDRFVMTTWHENDPLEDVMRFFRWNTAFNDFTPKNFIVILLGQNHVIEAEARRVLAQTF
jgi:hypothetical protein